MTFGHATSLTLGLAGAMALGVWAGPHMGVGSAPSAPVAVDLTQPMPTPAPAARLASATAARRALPAVSTTAPELQARLKPVFNDGTDLAIAANGFRSAEQFATVAHASRNTEVPFVLLKHRVLDEGKTLTTAIRESRPAINADIEVERARAEARSTIATIGGTKGG
jgi:hypothetical protein